MPLASEGDQHAASIAYQREEEADSALSEVLEDLPGYVSRGLLYLILALTAVALTWASLNKVKVLVEVPASVVPEGRLKIIQPPFTGTVSEIMVAEGDRVSAGQILLHYESDAVREMLLDLRAREAELALARSNLEAVVPERIAVLDERISLEEAKLTRREVIHYKTLDKLDSRLTRLGLETTNARGRLALLDRELDINSKLADKGIVAERRILELKRFREEAAIEIERLKSGISEALTDKEIEVETFNLEVESHRTLLAEINAEIASLLQEAEERFTLAEIAFARAHDAADLGLDGSSNGVFENLRAGRGEASDRAAITAPVDGVVSEITVHSAGETFERGQILITLVPTDATLLMELMVPDKDLGRLREGQPIRFKFAAFPYGEHGVLTGQIISISPSAVTSDGEAVFYRAKSPLDQNYFPGKDGKTYLLPGMTATAEIETNEETLMTLLLRPFAELAEPEVAGK